MDDAKYIGHLDLLIRDALKSANPDARRAATEARTVLDGILAAIPPDVATCRKDGVPSISQLDVWRWLIADQIMKLRVAISGK